LVASNHSSENTSDGAACHEACQEDLGCSLTTSENPGHLSLETGWGLLSNFWFDVNTE